MDPDFEQLNKTVEGSLPDEVDVVIVGAGAAGSVLAARLSEDPTCRVLLLEAGGTPGLQDAARVPGLAFALFAGDSAYLDMTAPQTALAGRQIALVQGRGLGGASSMNTMAWFEGHPADYDSWAEAGVPGWSWADVKPAFAALEDHELGRAAGHGTAGPMSITQVRDVSALPLTFLATGAQMGVPISRDFNGAERDGFGVFSNNVRDGRRWSVLDGYLAPAAQRENLTIRTGCAVTAVEIEQSRATGVHVRRGTSEHQVVARRAVVVAAGALRSPHLLMLSGVGPASELANLGIPVRRDLPGVGQNLQDHPQTTPTWPVLDGSPLRNAINSDDTRAYELARRGPLASFSQVGAMLRTDPSFTAADFKITLALLGVDEHMNVTEDPVVTAATAVLTPRSRGSVSLRSADPMAPPLVDPGYLSHPDDLARMRTALRLVRRVFEASPLAEATGAPLTPGDWSDDGLDRWIRGNCSSEWHPAGTCAMGTGASGVVDPTTMLVHGVESLYVADSSALPILTRGNLQAPVVMLAERAAARIRERALPPMRG